MKEKIDDGGFAFPVVGLQSKQGEWQNGTEFGMSLRDWFAGQALAGMAGLQDWTWEDTAKAAYEAADLMLKERLKEK